MFRRKTPPGRALFLRVDGILKLRSAPHAAAWGATKKGW